MALGNTLPLNLLPHSQSHWPTATLGSTADTGTAVHTIIRPYYESLTLCHSWQFRFFDDPWLLHLLWGSVTLEWSKELQWGPAEGKLSWAHISLGFRELYSQYGLQSRPWMVGSFIATLNVNGSQEHTDGLLSEGIWQYDHALGHLASEACGVWTRNEV